MKAITIALTLFLTACTAPDAGRVLLGLAQVQAAPACYESLVVFLDDDELASLDTELNFFVDTYRMAENFGFDRAFVDFVLSTPEVLDNAELYFAAVEATSYAHAERTGEVVPADLVGCAVNLRAGWSVLSESIQASDRTRTVLEYLRLIKPIVALASA